MKQTRITLIVVLICGAALLALPVSHATQTKSAAKQVTFTKDVAPIFFKHCVECHRAGEAAPFSTLAYKDVRPWARSIREKVVNRTMPPWHADPRFGSFSNDRRLTEQEINTIAAWVDGGAKEGDPRDLPPAPEFTDGWAIGKPDMVINMPEEFALEASGPDEYQYFAVDPGFTEDKYVQMAEARPGNRKIVHHILAFIQPAPKDQSAQMSKAEIEELRAKWERESILYRDGALMRTKADAPVFNDGCELENGGAGATRDGSRGTRSIDELGTLLTGFAPGMNPWIWEPGTIKKIPAGSKIVFQMHYSKASGKPEKDRSMLGLVFARQKPKRELITQLIANNYFLVPPGASSHRVTACWTAPADIHLTAVLPHMHVRGKAMEIKAFYPDGRRETLLAVPDFDFSWQTVYYFRQPPAIPKGTRLLVTGWFDNSAKNRFNPDPTKAVRWGEPTYDEMMVGFIDYTVDRQPLKSVALNSHQ
jgi:mono/diheme cytochrome c family protein